WLHPYKEQKLIVIGEKKMVLFDDVNPEDKLFLYNHKIEWIERQPIPHSKEAKFIKYRKKEPLKAECEHFIECTISRKIPKTDGNNGLKVLKILEFCQKSLKEGGKIYHFPENEKRNYLIHESSFVDEKVEIGEGTKIWHFSHILKNSKVGKNCNIGQNVVIGPNVTIGDNVKIQNNVSVYEGVTLEDDVFCGPSMVFTNVINPRSYWPRKNEYKKTLIKKGASLGANSTIVCGITVGQYSFVGAGALVNKNIPDHALVYGIPAKIHGWMCYCGAKLSLSNSPNSQETSKCANCGRIYKKNRFKVFEIDTR
ncbi:MAG: acyltransferase, partial [Candidatus Helarchaeota archaeon]